MSGALTGRGVVVTGGTRGLGLAIAHACRAAGADVLVCGRDDTALSRAVETLAAAPGPGSVDGTVADVTVAADVDRLVARAAGSMAVHGLVANAGVYGPLGRIEDVDWDAWQRTIDVNLGGTVRALRAVLPHLRAAGGGKVVAISGGGATAPLPRFSAYAASKSAIVRLVETVAEELRTDGIDVNAVAPGALNTRLLDEVLAAGPERVGADVHARAVRQAADGGASPEAAADLVVHLLSPASDGVTGRLVSAVWDPWDAPGHLASLEGTDVYTLRRIVPADRPPRGAP